MPYDTHTVPGKLRDFFKAHTRLALAFSGGVDSAYLLYAAIACGVEVHAYFVQTVFQPEFERRDALRFAKEHQAGLTILPYDVLTNETVAANPPDRCYHCKRAIFSSISRKAAADGYQTLIDGTNASDDAGDRPGMSALEELSVLSPLRLCGLTKAQIRTLSRQAGLSTWNKPAYACLVTRIPTGVQITRSMLCAVERAEETLFSLGFTDFRVRVFHDAARIQISSDQFPRLVAAHNEIRSALSADFGAVLLDLLPRQGESDA